MNANEFLARARGFLASEPVYALHDAGMAVALYAQNRGLHNFMVLAAQQLESSHLHNFEWYQ